MTSDKSAAAAPPGEVYHGLRRQILGLDPASVGIEPSASLPRVWGLLMETGFANGTATLVALADGTTSIYLSTGGGMIGAGEREQVAAATGRLLQVVERHLDRMPAGSDAPLPAPGRVVLRALTYRGHRAVQAEEDDLGHGRHVHSEIFHAAHDVITELRLLDEAERPGTP